MSDYNHRHRDGAQPGQLRDAMVHRLVSVGTVDGQQTGAPATARRYAAGILYEKYRNEIASKIPRANTGGNAAPEQAGIRRGEWA
ncbi:MULTISPECIES: hypothetical protein [Burkholderia]|uniref:hypothetical protein n=1 Tax=Burkholderia TaxID=32008 RepID=UPI001583E9B6|nr:MULTISPECIES: hypothetical protein [Burkholderia]